MNSNNKKIVKNTTLLYIRMFVLMAINLYMSRVVLQCLGVTDFGIYGIVGSVVTLFSFMNSAMSTCTSRFLSYYIGKNDAKAINEIFCASLNLYVVLLIIVLFFAESIGLYIVNNTLNIPEGRITAANWAYQFSIFTFCANILRIPYNSCIISYERMSFYAYLSIGDAVVKLVGISLLWLYDRDKLIMYSIIIFITTSIITFLFYIYCHKKLPLSNYKFKKVNKKQYAELLSFSGWSLFSGIANMGSNTGVNMLLNIFCGVTVNAAVSIANQVSNAMYSFVSNFQTAFTPQITKLYASNDTEGCNRLVYHSSKFSFYLFGILILPIMIAMPIILSLWLGNVPEKAVEFTNLILIYLLIDALFSPLWFYIDATGKIKVHQLVTGILILSNFPLAYIALIMHCSPESVWYIRIAINIIANIFRLIYISYKFNFPSTLFIRNVLIPIFVTSILIIFPAYYLYPFFQRTFAGTFLFVLCIFVLSVSIIYVFGLTKSERIFISNIITSKIHK